MPALQQTATLGIAAALLWGGGDFSGGMAVKHSGSTIVGALRVVLFGHIFGFAILTGIALSSGAPLPHGAPMLWALCGGVLAGISLIAFYIAISTGSMGVAAAVSGMLCATIPAIISALTEGRPSRQHIAGFLLAAASIWLIAASPQEQTQTTSARALWLSIFSGIGFGFYFVALKMASPLGVIWPTDLSRVGSATTCGLLLLLLTFRAQGASSGINVGCKRILPWTILGAGLDSSGNIFFTAAARAGRLDVAAVLASLYPASTILLAALILRERTTGRQIAGMILAAPAIALITL